MPALLLAAAVMASCGAPTAVRPRASVPMPITGERTEVLILPAGPEMAEDRSYWTLESQRLVLAYFDIFLRHGFRDRTSSRVIVVEDGYEPVGLEFDYEDLGHGTDQEWWGFAPQGGRLAHNGRYPDYVLIFDGLRFSIRQGGGARQSYDAPGTGRVILDLEYVLWDNEAQEVAASGQLHEEMSTNSPHASSQVFKELFERMADQVVRETPLGPQGS